MTREPFSACSCDKGHVARAPQVVAISMAARRLEDRDYGIGGSVDGWFKLATTTG